MGENLLSILFKKRAVKTLSYILEIIKERDDVEILTDCLGSYAPIRVWSHFPILLRKVIVLFEIHLWCLANKVPFEKLNYGAKKLKPETDLIFAYGTINSIFENKKLTQISLTIRTFFWMTLNYFIRIFSLKPCGLVIPPYTKQLIELK